MLTSKADRTRAGVPSNQVQASATVGAFHVRSSAIINVHGARKCGRQSSIVAIPRSRHCRHRRPASSAHAFRGRSNITSTTSRSARHGVRPTLLLDYRRLPFPVLSLAFVYIYTVQKFVMILYYNNNCT